ncbi:MAG: type III-A CRISPR-associated RAMP protein Csm3 [Bacteroidales bacterium]|nr:type III-A CRISPR-associated RAMP protein Csm3 [Bacteroidales bacterium]
MDTTKLSGKIIISGEIIVQTGLAIGGNKAGIEIGALDNPVIKTHKGIPFIPGSSLKGKLRSLLARAAGSDSVESDIEIFNLSNDELKNKNIQPIYKHIAPLFGYGAGEGKIQGNADKTAENRNNRKGEALLKVRDAFIKQETDGNEKFTEEKMENSIHRVTGVANPRPIERVLPGTVFSLDMYLDVYNNEDALQQLELLDLAFQLLTDDYLGGGGSRGNGKVEFKNFKITYKKLIPEGETICIKEKGEIAYTFKCCENEN